MILFPLAGEGWDCEHSQSVLTYTDLLEPQRFSQAQLHISQALVNL